MIVEEIMRTNVITLTQNHSINDAYKQMLHHKIRHLPIVAESKSKQLLGIVSDRDIRDALPSILIDSNEQRDVLEKPIKTIMKTNVITGHPLDFVEEVGPIFYEHHISCLPIVKEHALVGIITKTDLLHTLVELTGAHQPSSQIEIKVPNRAAVLSEMATIFLKRKTNILSILVYPYKQDEKFKMIVLRVQTINPTSLIEDLTHAGYQVLWPHLPGIPL
jgi:acetoin utilization protein AcuB